MQTTLPDSNGVVTIASIDWFDLFYVSSFVDRTQIKVTSQPIPDHPKNIFVTMMAALFSGFFISAMIAGIKYMPSTNKVKIRIPIIWINIFISSYRTS